jgi:hypothetical protein
MLPVNGEKVPVNSMGCGYVGIIAPKDYTQFEMKSKKMMIITSFAPWDNEKYAIYL